MKRFLFVCTLGMLALALWPSGASAQNFVYRPLNPSFGGDPFNGSFLLSVATAQNGFTADRESSPFDRDPIEEFQQTLNRQILSQLSRQLIDKAFGADEIQDGRFEIGDFIIDIVEGADGININIVDIGTGGETNITIPIVR